MARNVDHGLPNLRTAIFAVSVSRLEPAGTACARNKLSFYGAVLKVRIHLPPPASQRRTPDRDLANGSAGGLLPGGVAPAREIRLNRPGWATSKRSLIDTGTPARGEAT